MGSFIEINDTLQITKEQGFPEELNLEAHKKELFRVEDFEHKIFSFKDKADIRVYHSPPCRCFLAENTGSTWQYWGHILVQSIHHDYVARTTSGTFKIIKFFTPDEMIAARNILGVK